MERVKFKVQRKYDCTYIYQKIMCIHGSACPIEKRKEKKRKKKKLKRWTKRTVPLPHIDISSVHEHDMTRGSANSKLQRDCSQEMQTAFVLLECTQQKSWYRLSTPVLIGTWRPIFPSKESITYGSTKTVVLAYCKLQWKIRAVKKGPVVGVNGWVLRI